MISPDPWRLSKLRANGMLKLELPVLSSLPLFPPHLRAPQPPPPSPSPLPFILPMNLLTTDHPSSLDRFPPPLLRCRLSDILYRSPRRRLSESLIATDTAIAAFSQAMALLEIIPTVSYVKRGLILLLASEAVRLAHTTMAAGTQVLPQVMIRGAIFFPLQFP